MRKKPRTLPALAVTGLLCGAALAQAEKTDAPKNAAFLFAYQPKAGMEGLFNEGYKRHLQWHREKRDPLIWYAWQVVIGQRLGLFIDGTFGLSFADFDARVEPGNDAADFTQTSAPFATPVYRHIYRLRPELSTAGRLEEKKPSRLVSVQHFQLRPGMRHAFEEVLDRLKATLLRSGKNLPYTWYELVNGSEHPSFLWMVPLSNLAELGDSPATLDALAQSVLPPEDGQAVLERLSRSVSGSDSEIWLYQAALSYFPDSER